MLLDIVFPNGQTLALEIKARMALPNGAYRLTLPNDDKIIFNPEQAVLWGFREGDIADDKAEGTPTLSS